MLFNNQTVTTNASGLAAFGSVTKGENIPYKILYQNTLLNEGELSVLWADIVTTISFNSVPM